MRVLIATPLYPPELGGPATYSKILEEGLPVRDIAVTLLAFSEVRHQPKIFRHLLYFWKALQLARAVDVVLALDPVSVGLPAYLAARLAGKKFVVKVVGDYAWEQGRQRFGIWLPLDEFVRTKEVPLQVLLRRTVQEFVTRRALRVIVPSNYLKHIIQFWGIPQEKVSVIHNAVASTKPSTVPSVVADSGTPRIISVGRLVPWKGMHGLISAMPEIRTHVPTAELIIVGEGPDQEQLERFAEARVPGGVVFTGALPHDETLAAIAASDVVVLNSTYEGLSHLLIEALTQGSAVVATKAGGNPELIESEKNGLLISIGDPEGLARACVRLLTDTAFAGRLKMEAKKSMQDFSQERMLLATETLLRGV
ncbi:MAG: glycosyltransferase family 4 protein [Patescibacteria group bacterium]